MCRLFGLAGGEHARARQWLVDEDRSLLAQSHAGPDCLQDDGWGISWYPGGSRPRIEKGIRGAFEPDEKGLFESASVGARGPVVVAHLRRASNPMKLPPEQLIAIENSQPFSDGSSLFAHNGEIELPRETRGRLGVHDAQVKGVNDSEVLFWLFTKNLESHEDPAAAYAATRTELEQVWVDAGRPTKFPYTGLNVLYAPGGDQLWAFCHWLGEWGTGLFARDQPYYRMGYVEKDGMLVVGSEPFSSREHDWTPLENGRYVVGEVVDDSVRVRTGAIG